LNPTKKKFTKADNKTRLHRQKHSKEMRKTVKHLAVAAITTVIAWTHMNAQDTGLEALPEGFPVDLVTYEGDNRYTSLVFGDFTRVTSQEDYFHHDTLGPLTWEWNAETEVVTLNTEFFGPLSTALPDAVTPLGFSFPLVRHEINQTVYGVNVNEKIFGAAATEGATPFERWNDDGNGGLVSGGVFSYMGTALDNSNAFLVGAEGRITDMENIHVNLQNAINTLQTTEVVLGSQNFEEQRLAMIANWELFVQVYVRYLYYRERVFNTESFIANPADNPNAINEARVNATNLRNINANVENLFNATANLINNMEAVYAAKVAERNAAQAAADAAAAAAAAAAANQGGGGGGSTPPSNNDGGSTPSNDGGGTPAQGQNDGTDAITWDQVTFVGRSNPAVASYSRTGTINSFRIHRGSYYGPDSWYVDVQTSGTSGWPGYLPFGTGNTVEGNMWIFVPNGNGYYAAPFEGWVVRTTILPLGNLNFDHTNILAGSVLGAPWQPTSGENYGWMVSTNAGLYPGGNGSQRTNIFMQRWP
jgi:hypothetical protein